MKTVLGRPVINKTGVHWQLSIGLLCLFILFAAGPVVAQTGTNVSAEVDREQLSTDEQVTLTITVAGSFEQIGDPELPSLSGFRIVGSSRSSQFSMENGVVTSRILFIYRLQPTQPGNLVIPPVTVQVNGVSYQTEAISIDVTSDARATPGPSPGATGAAPAAVPDLFVEANVDNNTPFLGQQITYRFRFFQATTVFGQPELEWPAFSGFWTEALTPEDVYQQTKGGHEYRVTQVRQALFPTVAGQLGIEPTTLRIPGALFEEDTLMLTDPITVNVRPLPVGAPAGFDGAVGQYQISATLEPQTVRVNEPVTLRLRLWGTGNIAALSDPADVLLQDLSDWRVYQAQVTTNVDQEGTAIEGEKLFQRLMVPKLAGELEMPPITFVFFDPQTARYQQIATERFTIRVAPGEAASPSPATLAESGTGDIRHIKPVPLTLTTGRLSILQQPVFWLGWLLPLAGLVGVWGWNRRRERLEANVAQARSKRAFRTAQDRLKRARIQAAQDEESAYMMVAKAMNEFVGDKLSLPTAGLTRDALRGQLASRGVSTVHIDRFLACLEWADSGRFAPIAAGEGPTALVAAAEQAVQQLERVLNEHESGRPLDPG